MIGTPPLLAAAALLFWGWQAGLLLAAVPLAVLLEGARLLRWRWEFSRDDFDRLSSATSLMSWGIAGYLFVTTDPSRALTTLFQWLPLLLVPLLLAQAYGTADRVDVTGLFWTIRRRRAARDDAPRRAIDLGYPFVAVCVLAAAAANVRTAWFYAGLVAVSAWALWRVRAARVSPLAWVALFAVAAGLGHGAHVGLHELQRVVEATALEWVTELLRRDTDPFRSSTAIGSIGSLKLADRIVLRVESDEGAPPALLRDASYNIYNAPTWLAFDAGFNPIAPEEDGTVWRLGPGRPRHDRVTISAYLRRGRGVLALPTGTFQLDRLTAVGISKNPLGAVRVDEGLGLSTFRARFAPRLALDEAPTDLDVKVPITDGAVIARVAGDLGLAGRSPAEARAAVARHFGDRFRYATYLAERRPGTSALEDFLLRTRAGHCEYFATATVLLMRAAGVPARYATGYAVQEWSRLENRWVVRARHAHSWALVYLDGAWQDFDTTPAAWADEEARQLASFWQPVSDFTSWALYVFARWRWGERSDGLGRYLGWLLVPLVVLLVWRLYFRRPRTRLVDPEAPAAPRGPWTGADSELYAIEARLREVGLGRAPSEPLTAWIARVEDAAGATIATSPLREVIGLHYRYRFDPDGLSAADRESLRARARSWLERHRTLSLPR